MNPFQLLWCKWKWRQVHWRRSNKTTTQRDRFCVWRPQTLYLSFSLLTDLFLLVTLSQSYKMTWFPPRSYQGPGGHFKWLYRYVYHLYTVYAYFNTADNATYTILTFFFFFFTWDTLPDTICASLCSRIRNLVSEHVGGVVNHYIMKPPGIFLQIEYINQWALWLLKKTLFVTIF